MTVVPHDEETEREAAQPDRSPLAINFVADAGKLMLESSPSVSEVVERLRRFLPAVGLDGCSVDANMSSILLSYWAPGAGAPITIMREVKVSQPQLALLAGAESLLGRVERGEIDLVGAVQQLAQLERGPRLPPRYVYAAILVSVVGWVLFLNGLDTVTVLVALLSTLLTFPVDATASRLRLPPVSVPFLAAVIVAAVPNLLSAAGLSLKVGPAVVGALFVLLPGRALVSSVIDGLANAPLSAVGRGIQTLVTAGSLALGMLVGTKIGVGLGLEYQPDVIATPLAVSVLASAIGVLGLAVAWGMPRRFVLPTVVMGAAGWLIFAVMATEGAPTDWPTYALAAGLIGLSGAILASRMGATASVYAGVAILPLVPGFSLYRGALLLSQGRNTAALVAFGGAAIISIAIAIGLAIGLAVGANVLVARDRVVVRHRA